MTLPESSVMDRVPNFEQLEVVKRLLPTRWEEFSRSSGALIRPRGVRNAETFLRLILLHVAPGLSKDATAQRIRGGCVRGRRAPSPELTGELTNSVPLPLYTSVIHTAKNSEQNGV